jgi:hypothetical protein
MNEATQLLFLIFLASVAAGAGLWIGLQSVISLEKMTVAGVKWLIVKAKNWGQRQWNF